jgi:hypothetical protein
MRRAGQGRPGDRITMIAAALVVLAAGLAAGGPGGTGGKGGPQAADRIVLDTTPGARAVEPLLARLWDSGFFRHNDAVRRELLNNDYAFFGPDSPAPPPGVKGLGCYSRNPGRRDTIFLRKDLFSRLELGLEGITIYQDRSQRVLPILVHEICHDLWMNVLDDRERAAFAREGQDLMEQYCLAQTADDRRLFLLYFGDDLGEAGCRRSYSEIDRLLAARAARPVCAHELFAWLAERFFVTKARIPRPLQKYYSCVIAAVPTTRADAVR